MLSDVGQTRLETHARENLTTAKGASKPTRNIFNVFAPLANVAIFPPTLFGLLDHHSSDTRSPRRLVVAGLQSNKASQRRHRYPDRGPSRPKPIGPWPPRRASSPGSLPISPC